jgi:hypothetical protein
MNETNSQIDDTIDLATLMRPFLVGKDIPVVMGTLCLLLAEALTVVGDPKAMDRNVDLIGVCIRGYIEQIGELANDAP